MDETKLQSLVAYIANQVRPGKLKLFKLMYLADLTASATLGHSISGDLYENFEMGPVPIGLWKNFAAVTAKCVDVTEVPTGGGLMNEQQLSARADFKPQLDADEQRVVDQVLTRFGRWSGNQLKEYTHKTLPYRATRRGEIIPFGLAGYLEYRKPTQHEVNEILADDALMGDIREALRRRSA
jgi:uncharacterized phage-associated protein